MESFYRMNIKICMLQMVVRELELRAGWRQGAPAMTDLCRGLQAASEMLLPKPPVST